MLMHVSVKENDKSKEVISDEKISGQFSELKNKKISRKKFFQRIGLASLIPLAGIWYSTSKRTQLREKQIKKITIPSNVPSGISFYEPVIVSKEKGQIKVFSAKCTHLGCIINKTENDVLVCPCHGSQYAFNGTAVKGPAKNPLQKLPFKINPQTGEITVDVQV